MSPQEHRLAVPRSARYFTIGQPEREVWFVLHGYAQLAARFVTRFDPIDDGTRLVVAPEGLSRFYVTEDPAERRVGASWMTKEDRIAEIEDYVRYLDAVHAEVVRSAVSVTVLGFSQGASTACRWSALGTSRMERLIVWGGEVPPDVDMRRASRLSLVYGSRDEYFTPKVVAANEARLRDQGVPYELVPYEGVHEIDPDVLKRLAAPARP